MKEEKKAVLYVEDDRDDQQLFEEVLKSVNPEFECFIATDGEHAFDVLKKIDVPVCKHAANERTRISRVTEASS
jgi:CheY-like chemotaxis protein